MSPMPTATATPRRFVSSTKARSFGKVSLPVRKTTASGATSSILRCADAMLMPSATASTTRTSKPASAICPERTSRSSGCQ
jgi:hypothetical protein